MRQLSFFTKLFLGNLLLIVLLVSISGVVSYRYLNADFHRTHRAHQDQMALMAQKYFDRAWPDSPAQIDQNCKELFPDSDLRLTVISQDGRVLGDSDPSADPGSMENHKTDSRPEVMGALRGESGENTRTSQTLGVAFRYIARPIRRSGEIVGCARVAMPLHAIAQGQQFIRRALVWASLVGLTVAMLLELLLSWIWYAPLRLITRAAKRIASGNLTGRVHISGSDELAQLAAALNNMREDLARQFDLIATQRENLQTVISNLREGVVALSNEGRIVLMNASAQELLTDGAGDTRNQLLQEAVRLPEVVDIFNEVLSSGQSQGRQVEIDDAGRHRIVDLNAVKVSTTPGNGIAVLLVARDISDLAQMASVKAEFVANASHELRTPLATIRAAVDSLGGIDPSKPEEFEKIVGMLDRHTTRLENMTNDLLDLRLVETSRHQPKQDEVRLGSLSAWAQEQFAQRAADHHVEFDITADGGEQWFTSDRTLLRLILQNLLDNAIKFTPVGGKVDCLLRYDADEKLVLLHVEDTGCGIPRELQSRVFERFFQAETSRSGNSSTRGTGLGLAIVKHAVDRLGAHLKLQSEPGRGTTVDVVLPLRPAEA
jgi:two-component system, OmpR family, phosphate regulon sensor histidine kinase PhoR